MSNYIDETGKRYGRLTVIRFYKRENKKIYWLCKCDCGNEVAVYGSSLRKGRTKSCGCWARDRMVEYHKGLRESRKTSDADLVEVVRCKDCKHSYDDLPGRCCSFGALVDTIVPDDFFCAYGVRMNDA